MAVDVVDLIMQDHREVERLFEALRTNPDKRPNLVPVLTALLTAHSRAEEAEVYPVARDEAGETDQVAHSQEEHVEADQLLARLVASDQQSGDFDDVLNELVSAVKHHVEEEETKVLPGLRQRLSDDRRAELGEAFANVREQHLGEQPGQITKEELTQQARNAGIKGASTMSKNDLSEELKASAQE
jgi:hemerythrin superfamily protein